MIEPRSQHLRHNTSIRSLHCHNQDKSSLLTVIVFIDETPNFIIDYELHFFSLQETCDLYLL